mmetsp:Transcript_48265/g.86025  ORF Transcript_48265/g.86025 Transcript_48265/m.86025 type:complete len:101 (-) Transcript_48265:487-789(-)
MNRSASLLMCTWVAGLGVVGTTSGHWTQGWVWPNHPSEKTAGFGMLVWVCVCLPEHVTSSTLLVFTCVCVQMPIILAVERHLWDSISYFAFVALCSLTHE